MFYLKIVHDYPNCMDSIVGPYQSEEEVNADLAKHGWNKKGCVYTKMHPKQGWEMRAFPEKFDALGLLSYGV